ncbi:MAG TPA: septum formation initiator family protein [Chryseosolibacter sp.]|nr:septum formation initiator family protein [Chryseosolibacter sp.]
MLTKLPKAFKNFYVVSLAIFFIWMLALDSNNLIARWQLSSKLRSLEHEKEYYEEKIQDVQKDHDELFGDRGSIEKFAREKYLMKKESEDIYVIVEE